MAVHLNQSPQSRVTLTVDGWRRETVLNSGETKIKNFHLGF